MLFKRKRSVRVYVQDGPTLEGTLAARTRHAYVLWAPAIVDENGRKTAVVGNAEVPRSRVLWYQVLG